VIGKIGVYIVAPIFLLLLPVDYFDHGQSISIFEWIGVDGYYSKGLTKACMHLLHLDIRGAASFNKLSFVVLPLIVGLWTMGFLREVRLLRHILKTTSANSDDTTEKKTL
jgi:hypothetical protein